MRALGCLLVLCGGLLAGPRYYMTDFGRRVLARTDQIVEAKVVRVLPRFRGITTAKLQVTRHISGYDKSTTLLLMYVDDLTAPDAFDSTLERSSVSYERRRKDGLKKAVEDLSQGKLPKPEEKLTGKKTTSKSREKGGTVKAGQAGVRLAQGESALFFLARGDRAYSLVGMVPAADPLFKNKRGRLEQVIKLERGALDLRATQLKRFFLGSLAHPNDWERGNSAREILSLATRFPDVFSKAEAKQLTTQLLREKEIPIQAALERAVRAIDPQAAMAFAKNAEERERKRFQKQLNAERDRLDKLKLPQLKANDVYRTGRMYGRAATGLVALYLSDEEPLVRERAAQALAEFGGPSCRLALREALAVERNDDAAAAMIYACGVKSDPKAVPMITERLQSEEVEHIAIQALARIGGPDARTALEKHKAKGGEIAILIDSLLREEFSRKK